MEGHRSAGQSLQWAVVQWKKKKKKKCNIVMQNILV